jgi:hypothetical protein
MKTKLLVSVSLVTLLNSAPVAHAEFDFLWVPQLCIAWCSPPPDPFTEAQKAAILAPKNPSPPPASTPAPQPTVLAPPPPTPTLSAPISVNQDVSLRATLADTLASEYQAMAARGDISQKMADTFAKADRVVAAGAGNVVAAGAGNVVAAGAGNVVAAGAGNVVAAGAGNVVATGGGNLIGAVILERLAKNNVISQDQADKIIAAGGGNIVAAGGGNLIGHDGASVVGTAGGSLAAVLQGAGISGAQADKVSHMITSDGASLVTFSKSAIVAAGGGNLIGHDGASLIGHDGAGLIGLVSHDGGSLVSHDGGSLVGHDGGGLIGNAGGALVSTNGGNLVSNAGGTLIRGPSLYKALNVDSSPEGAMDAIISARTTRDLLVKNIAVGAARLATNPNDVESQKKLVSDQAKLAVMDDPTGKGFAKTATTLVGAWQQTLKDAQGAADKQGALVKSDLNIINTTTNPEVKAQMLDKYRKDLADLEPMDQAIKDMNLKVQAASSDLSKYAAALKDAGGTKDAAAVNAIAQVNAQVDAAAKNAAAADLAIGKDRASVAGLPPRGTPVTVSQPAYVPTAEQVAASAAAAGNAAAAKVNADTALKAAADLQNVLGNRPGNLQDRLKVDVQLQDAGVKAAEVKYQAADAAVKAAEAKGGMSRGALNNLRDAAAAAHKDMMFVQDLQKNNYATKNATANFADTDLQTAKAAVAALTALAGTIAPTDKGQLDNVNGALGTAKVLQQAAQARSDQLNADAQLAKLTAARGDPAEISRLQAVSAKSQADLANIVKGNQQVAQAAGLAPKTGAAALIGSDNPTTITGALDGLIARTDYKGVAQKANTNLQTANQATNDIANAIKAAADKARINAPTLSAASTSTNARAAPVGAPPPATAATTNPAPGTATTPVATTAATQAPATAATPPKQPLASAAELVAAANVPPAKDLAAAEALVNGRMAQMATFTQDMATYQAQLATTTDPVKRQGLQAAIDSNKFMQSAVQVMLDQAQKQVITLGAAQQTSTSKATPWAPVPVAAVAAAAVAAVVVEHTVQDTIDPRIPVLAQKIALQQPLKPEDTKTLMTEAGKVFSDLPAGTQKVLAQVTADAVQKGKVAVDQTTSNTIKSAVANLPTAARQAGEQAILGGMQGQLKDLQQERSGLLAKLDATKNPSQKLSIQAQITENQNKQATQQAAIAKASGQFASYEKSAAPATAPGTQQANAPTSTTPAATPSAAPSSAAAPANPPAVIPAAGANPTAGGTATAAAAPAMSQADVARLTQSGPPQLALMAKLRDQATTPAQKAIWQKSIEEFEPLVKAAQRQATLTPATPAAAPSAASATQQANTAPAAPAPTSAPAARPAAPNLASAPANPPVVTPGAGANPTGGGAPVTVAPAAKTVTVTPTTTPTTPAAPTANAPAAKTVTATPTAPKDDVKTTAPVAPVANTPAAKTVTATPIAPKDDVKTTAPVAPVANAPAAKTATPTATPTTLKVDAKTTSTPTAAPVAPGAKTVTVTPSVTPTTPTVAPAAKTVAVTPTTPKVEAPKAPPKVEQPKTAVVVPNKPPVVVKPVVPVVKPPCPINPVTHAPSAC